MLELPEAVTIAEQLSSRVLGRKIVRVQAGFTPHGFAFFQGDPAWYPTLLEGRTLDRAQAYGGLVELEVGETRLALGDGVNLRLLEPDTPRPSRHQLLAELDDGSALACTVQMYGGIWAFPDGKNDNFYYLVAKEKASPLSAGFDEGYFTDILSKAPGNLSAKAVLATEQRIPGLGNGCVQDILFRAGIHPKRKLDTLLAEDRVRLFQTLKKTMKEMADQGGRDTEKDLYGRPGGYQTYLSAKTWKGICPFCGGGITRQAFLGGNVYFCAHCQPLIK